MDKTAVLHILMFVFVDKRKEDKYTEMNGGKHSLHLICS